MALLNIRSAAKVKFTSTGKMRVASPGYGYGGGGGGGGLSSGLQAFYRLSDTSDSSGNNRTLTNNGNVSFASGKIGNAAVFDGSNWMEQSFTLDSLNSGDFTISSWVKSAGSHDTSYPQIICTSNNGGGLAYRTDTQEFYYVCQNGGQFILGYGLPVDEQWHFILIKKTGTEYKLFVDNDYVTGTSESTFGAGNLLIGSIQGSYGFNGQIDAVGIWNRALTLGEVSSLYNSGAGIEL